MIEKQNCWEEMTTEQLDKALHVELAMKQKNRDKIVGILHVLEEREMKQSAQMTKEVRQVWRRYQNQEERTEPSKIKSIVLKVTAIAAIFCLIIFAVPPIFGEASFVDAIATWTDEIFRFTGTPQEISGLKNYEFKTDHPGLQEIYDTVSSFGVTDPVVPMWLPEALILLSVEVSENDNIALTKAFLASDRTEVMLLFSKCVTPREHQKEHGDVELYVADKREYYIVRNNTETKVVWSVRNIECSISIAGEPFDIYKMINSIKG